ncbi:TC1DB-like protein [Mya arenaria]|uniref:TC1DB-like protein n=2 Tax=Mya arenaria TaxID=6604 RepID=A0ABY7DWJ6_MYAAR|nr:TC1DB-like protein [Mya arenaria]
MSYGSITMKTSMSANERLTIQALKDHDKVHPKMSASGATPVKESSRISVSSRRSHTSGEQTSSRSDKNSHPPTKLNYFKFVLATKAWRQQAKDRSIRSEKLSKPVVKYENTYKTEPEDGQLFAPGRVEQMIKETLEHRLKTVKYSSDKSRIIATELTADIKSKVKAMGFPRYKIVCNIIITENKRQGLEVASRCIWNQQTDNFASYTYRNASLIAIANVHGVYFE